MTRLVESVEVGAGADEKPDARLVARGAAEVERGPPGLCVPQAGTRDGNAGINPSGEEGGERCSRGRRKPGWAEARREGAQGQRTLSARSIAAFALSSLSTHSGWLSHAATSANEQKPLRGE